MIGKERRMKRKLLATILCLTISASMIACGNVDTAERQEVTATEQTTETEIIEATEEDISDNGIPESEGWTEYSETYDYMVEHTSASMAHMLNPDVYGTETTGKSTGDFPFSLQPDTGEYIKRLELTTTKGYRLEKRKNYWSVT